MLSKYFTFCRVFIFRPAHRIVYLRFLTLGNFFVSTVSQKYPMSSWVLMPNPTLWSSWTKKSDPKRRKKKCKKEGELKDLLEVWLGAAGHWYQLPRVVRRRMGLSQHWCLCWLSVATRNLHEKYTSQSAWKDFGLFSAVLSGFWSAMDSRGTKIRFMVVLVSVDFYTQSVSCRISLYGWLLFIS